MDRKHLSARHAGFTLIELAIVIVVFAVVLGGIAGVTLSSELFSSEYTQDLVINQTGWRMMDRLGAEIQSADPDSVQPLVMADSSWITFQAVEGYSGGAPVLSDPITIAYQPVTGETVNGTDDNGDGRVDEGVIEYRSGNPVVTIQVAGNILGVRFNPIAGGIEYSVDVGLVDREGNLVWKTFTEKVAYRN